MAKISIAIAPKLNEVRIRKNVVSTKFNGLHIVYTMPENQYLQRNPLDVKQALRDGIAISSKLWFLEELLNNYFKWDGHLKVTNLETNKVLYPVI